MKKSGLHHRSFNFAITGKDIIAYFICCQVDFETFLGIFDKISSINLDNLTER
ncbi:hypothetical protein HY008_01970 [Candidatus Woesebacteria bacterium]|nr:hypothetical protein [Candidatus Woesebacteria bacterium]